MMMTVTSSINVKPPLACSGRRLTSLVQEHHIVAPSERVLAGTVGVRPELPIGLVIGPALRAADRGGSGDPGAVSIADDRGAVVRIGRNRLLHHCAQSRELGERRIPLDPGDAAIHVEVGDPGPDATQGSLAR